MSSSPRRGDVHLLAPDDVDSDDGDGGGDGDDKASVKKTVFFFTGSLFIPDPFPRAPGENGEKPSTKNRRKIFETEKPSENGKDPRPKDRKAFAEAETPKGHRRIAEKVAEDRR